MARAFKLNDLQLILLSTAAQRGDGSLLPPPESVGAPASRLRKLIPPLIRQALVDEVEVAADAQVWRSEGERRIGLVINNAGRAAIGVEPAGAAPEAPDVSADEPAPTAAGTSKIAAVLTLLRREQGATLDELIAATGWLPHTTRAALTGLRKKGHVVDKSKRGEITYYRVAA